MRNIEVTVSLADGQRHTCVLPENAPVLADLYVGMAGSRIAGYPGTLMQLPAEGGRAAFSFMSTSILSVATEPPVLVNVGGGGLPVNAPAALPGAAGDRFVRIDDFLTPAENEALLRFAIEQEENYARSGVYNEKEHTTNVTVRRSRVLYNIAQTPWKPLFIERLKLHLPHLLRTLKVPAFDVREVEIQLTASNDGDFFKRHSDTDRSNESIASRQLTFVYYLNRTPKPYSGGNILFYDEHAGTPDDRGARVDSVSPANNCLVSFASDRWHEVEMVRCPSGAFADSRFTVNGWLRSQTQTAADAGHSH